MDYSTKRAAALKQAEELAALCAQIADDRKAENIVTLHLSEFSVIADYFVLCTANSEPHLRAVSERIQREVREKLEIRPRHTEGTPASQWIIVDYCNVVVHVLTPEKREAYSLESLWGDAPKLEAIKTLEKGSSTEDEA